MNGRLPDDRYRGRRNRFTTGQSFSDNSPALDANASDVYPLFMRTTLEIDDDVLEAIRALARQTRKTAGEVLSGLARKALTMASRGKGRPKGVGGFSPFESRGGIVTNEAIDRLRESDAY